KTAASRQTLAGNRLWSVATRSMRCARRSGALPHALDQMGLPRGDVEEHQRGTIRPSTIRLPRLNQFGADIQIARKHRLRGMESSSHALDGTAVQRLGW